MMPSDCHIAWVRSQSDATAEDSTADPHSALSEHTTDWSDGMSEEVHTTQTSQTRQKCENGQCVSERDVLHHGNDMMQSASCGSCVGHLSETTHRQREETAHRDREETARREREETARREREETARREREETARREREETAHREREETAHREREETAHREREETAHREREEPCPELCVVRHTLSPEGADSWEIDTINSPPSCSLITSAVAENGMSSFHCSSDKVENGMSSFDCSSDKVENGMSSFHCSSEEAENGMSSFHCSSDEADGDDGKYLSYRRDIKGQVLVDDAGTPDRQDVKGQVLVDDAGTSDRQDEETVSRDSCPSSGCEHLDEAGHVSVLQSSSYVQMFHSQNNFSQRRSDSLSQGSGECSSVVASNGELSSCAWTSPQQCVSEPSVVIQLGQDEGGCGQHTKPERTLLDLSSSVNSDLSPGDPIDSSSQLAGHGNLTEKSAAVKHRFAGDQGHAQTGVVEHAAASDHGNSETRGPGEHSGSRPFAFSRSEQVPCSGSIKQHSGVDTSASEPVDQALSHLPEDLQTKRDMCSVDSSNNGLSLTLANLSQAVSPSSGDSQAAMNTVSLQHSQGDPLLGSSVDGDALCAPAAQQDNQSCDSGLERNQSSNTPVVSVSLSQVPDEVLLQVFSFFLPVELCRHVTLVCKCWHRLAYDDSLWRKLDLSCLRVSGFQLCQIILRVSGAVRYLDISGMMHLTNAEMAIVAEHCPQLAHLDVGFVDDWNATMMHSVLTCCPNLQFLNMEGCRHANNEMMREVTASAGSGLRRLNFSHCSMVDESFMLMMHHLPGLTHLNIDGISWISEMVIQSLASKYFSSLLSWELDGNELTDSAIRSVSTCHGLNTLSITFTELLTDQSLRHLKCLENLKKLALRKGYSFTSAGLVEFLSSPTLQNLTYLDLTECQQLDDEGVKAIAKGCGSKLTMLCLSWCWDVTDRGMEYVAAACSRLVQLYLVGLHRLEGVWLPLAVDNMKNLVYISFEQCNEVVDTVIEDAVRDKVDLVIINYYGEVFMHTPDPAQV